jgi:hypothetical protein
LKRRLNDDSGDELLAVAPTVTQAAAPAPDRGGIRRRLIEGKQSSNRGEASSSLDLPLTKLLKKRWAEGKASSPEVQEYALAASQQGKLVMNKLLLIRPTPPNHAFDKTVLDLNPWYPDPLAQPQSSPRFRFRGKGCYPEQFFGSNRCPVVVGARTPRAIARSFRFGVSRSCRKFWTKPAKSSASAYLRFRVAKGSTEIHLGRRADGGTREAATASFYLSS